MAKSKRKPAPVPVNSPPELRKSMIAVILYIIWLFFKWVFVFSVETCLNPLTWLISMAIRGFVIMELINHSSQIDKLFQYTGSNSILQVLSDLFALLYPLFCLWYFFTSLIMFLGAIRAKFGTRNSNDEVEYSEFKKLADYANNKMRFQSYKDSMDMLTGKGKK